ncbi:MAG: DUF748 domain-containing protein [Nitrospinae bacterium]|nr:DUF748 domain-containing protein [Nitrospinota bacterium]
MSKPVKIISIFVGGLVILYICLTITVKFLVTKEKVEAMLLPLVEKTIQKKLVIGDFSASFGGATLTNVTLFEGLAGKQPLVTFKTLEVEVDIIRFITGSYSVKSIFVDEMKFNVTRFKDGKFNFEPESDTTKDASEKIALPKQIIELEEFQLKNAALYFNNLDPQFPLKSTDIKNIHLELDDLVANLGNEEISLGNLMVNLVNAGSININGKVKSFLSNPSAEITIQSGGVHPIKILRLVETNIPQTLEEVKVALKHQITVKEKEIVLNSKIDIINPKAGSIKINGKVKSYKSNPSAEITVQSEEVHPIKILRLVKTDIPKTLEDLKASFQHKISANKKEINLTSNIHVTNSGEFNYSAKPSLNYNFDTKTGNISVSDVSLKNAPFGTEPNLLTLSKIDVNQLNINEDKIHISSINIEQPHIVFEKSNDGKINNINTVLKGLLSENNENKSKESGDKKPDINIGQVNVKQAQFTYIDPTLQTPPFRMGLKDFALTLKDINPNRLSSLSFNGILSEGSKGGSIKGSGSVNLFDVTANKLQIFANRIHLEDFSSIAEKASGIKIQKGLTSLSSVTNLNKKGDFASVSNIRVEGLQYTAPPVLYVSSKVVQEVLEKSNGVLQLKELKLSGNIYDNDFNFWSAAKTVLGEALTNNAMLSAGMGAVLIGGASLLPPVAVGIGAVKLFDYLTKDDKKEKSSSNTGTNKEKESGGILGIFDN